MKSLVLVSIAAVGMLAGAGCNRAKTETFGDTTTKTANSNLVNPKITIARGCLTGGGGQFVLTNLEQAEPAPPAEKPDSGSEPIATTESYRLVGMGDQLQALVGQRVEVTGASEPDGVVDLVSATPATAPNSGAAGTSGSDSKVSTASRARVEIHGLRVRSVNPLGDKCPGSSERP